MKIRNILFTPTLFIVMTSALFSCGVDRWPEYAAETELDTWIDSVMHQEYLWYKEIPTVTPNKYFLAPAQFLKEIIYTTLDKNYSYIDTLNKVQLPDYGFDYTLIKNSKTDTLYEALITNVLPGSPASDAKLKRGEWIIKVDDKLITKKNESKLLQSGNALKLTLGKYELQEVEEDKKATTTKKEKGVVVETRTVNMAGERIVEDDPIPVYEVVTSATRVKVGYMVYNHFTAGTTAEKEKYNNKLRDISRVFASAGVTKFVLDLRYNTGGSLQCAQLLASLLAPQAQVGKIFAELRYNDKQSYKDFSLLFDPDLIGSGSNMNIDEGYILTSSSTTTGIAGTFYDCLFPLNKWKILGAALPSTGVATESFINPKHGWSLNPVVCNVYNSAGESHGGGSFPATYTVDETSTKNLVTFLPLGDKEETLFNMALGIIDGTYPPKEEEKPDEGTEEKPETRIIKNVYHSQSYRVKGGIKLK